MREIIFRGKRLDNGEWVYGDYFKNHHGWTGIMEQTREARCHDVDPATVGQYTGLTDRNGKKIFEGDIIQTPKYGVDNGSGQNYSGKDKFVVEYADGTYTLENRLRRFCLRPDIDAVVCGNRWDNPELLEVKDND